MIPRQSIHELSRNLLTDLVLILSEWVSFFLDKYRNTSVFQGRTDFETTACRQPFMYDLRPTTVNRALKTQ